MPKVDESRLLTTLSTLKADKEKEFGALQERLEANFKLSEQLKKERNARQDEIKSFCKELRKVMAGKGFKREHFSQLEQWVDQVQDQAVSFTEFQRVALAIFGDYGAVFAKETIVELNRQADKQAEQITGLKANLLVKPKNPIHPRRTPHNQRKTSKGQIH
ncbi:hypothetical protein [Helicobacter salomonis]|uniref:hypothetical protein n=1 Tax=Helicobacter salomonis TaxID=56878 RepID=UPI000CF16F14|nr:hypothetical protein [Helicobacter salomonis]